MPLTESSALNIARRAAREITPGAVVALDRGLPELVAQVTPESIGAWFLRTDGTLNGIPLNSADAAAVLRGGHVDLAIVHPAQVIAGGSFVGGPNVRNAGIDAPGNGVDLSSGARRVIALHPQINEDDPEICLAQVGLAGPNDGIDCVDIVISDCGVFKIQGDEFVLSEVAADRAVHDVLVRVSVPEIVSVSSPMNEMDITPLSGSPPSKIRSDGPSAVADVPDGATVFIDGFGGPGGMAHYLLISLRDRGSRNLTIVSNTAGIARVVSFGTPPGRTAIDHSVLIENGQVAKAIASFPVSPSVSRPSEFELAYRRGEVDLELVPQGTLAERLRAGGAGVHAFYTPTGAGTLIAEGKETRTIDGRDHILEHGLRADFAIIRAHKADTNGNLVYRGTSRNFNAVMAPAARITVAEVDEIVQPGDLDPEEIVTPGVFVQRVVKRPEGFTGYE
jgi:3-oxoadipate CoA-transferase alpha subunit